MSAGRQTLMGVTLKNFTETQRSGSINFSKNYLSSASKQETTKGLVDKTAQNNYIDNIYNFLLEIEFDHSLSTKILKQPSSKLFFGIFNHLISMIDEKLLEKNVLTDDKLPMIIKHIGYPYMLPKAVFVALTAPHTWPHLLCLLSWMVDLVKYKRSYLKEAGYYIYDIYIF